MLTILSCYTNPGITGPTPDKDQATPNSSPMSYPIRSSMPPPPPITQTSPYSTMMGGLPRNKTLVAAETAWLQIAAISQLVGDNERSQASLENILCQNPSHVGAFVRLGHLLHNQQQYMQAAEAYQKAISLWENSGNTPNAAAVASSSTGVNLPGVWAALAHCWLLLDDLPRAFNAYQQALGYPGGARDATLWFGVGLLYDRYAADEHALEAFSAVLRLEPNPNRKVPSPMLREVYYRIGLLLRNRQRYDAAKACLEYVSHYPPAPLQRADIKLQLAITLDVKGELTMARRILENNVIRDSRRSVATRARCLLGWIMVKLGQQQSSSGQQDHQSPSPSSPTTDNQQQQEDGIALLRQVVQEEQSDALAWYYLGRSYLMRKMYTQSYEAYQEAVYRDAQNAAFWNSIGILYLEIRQFRDALDAFSRSIHQNPSIFQVWWNLGVLYESCNNQINDAIDAYQRAAELSPLNIKITDRITALRRAAAASNKGNNVQLVPTMDVQEIDPLPFITRPILLGTAHIPPQKSASGTVSALMNPPPVYPQKYPLNHQHQAPHHRMSLPPSSTQPMPPTYRPGYSTVVPSSQPPPPHQYQAVPTSRPPPSTIRPMMPPMPSVTPSNAPRNSGNYHPYGLAPRPPFNNDRGGH